MRFPGSKMTAVAFAAVLLGGATAWIGAREPSTAAQDTAPQPVSAPADGQPRTQPGYARNRNAPAAPRQPTTRTRAS